MKLYLIYFRINEMALRAPLIFLFTEHSYEKYRPDPNFELQAIISGGGGGGGLPYKNDGNADKIPESLPISVAQIYFYP